MLCALLGTSVVFATPACLLKGQIDTGTPDPKELGSKLDGGVGGLGDGGYSPDAGGPPTSTAVCTPPIRPVDTSHPSTVVGTGTPASCTEEVLNQAILRGGTIAFDCGGNATIPITSQKELRPDVDTTIDGQGQITLNGNGATRLFHFRGPNYRTNTATVTLQNLRLTNGRATGTPIPEYPSEPAKCARGFRVDGGGGAIYIQDGILHVFNTTFENNHGEPLGPDVAGGAIYGLGAREIIVVGSHFINNSASNGGAIGALNTDLSVYNSIFDGSAALGHDANGWDPDCPPDEESGSGGNGGAICIDGGDNGLVVFCGDTFTRSRGGENAFGGAIFRTPDIEQQTTIIDQSTFDESYSPHSGGALYFHNSNLQISKSTFSENRAVSGGSLQADGTVLQVENSTFANNHGDLAWGVAALFDVQGDFRNCTFVGNSAGFSPITPEFAGASIENSVFVGNTSVGGNTACDAQSAGSGNLQWPQPDRSGPNAPSGCVLGVSVGDPALSQLGDHGGPTSTFLPGAPSNALRRGSGCPQTDQRGWPRADRTACTVGSVEVQ